MTRRMRGMFVAAILGAMLGPVTEAPARVARVEVERREALREGAYEKLAGTVWYEFDPEARANAGVVDLRLAPRNERGMVEARGNFMVLQPADPAHRRGVALLEVSNRGGKASLGYFNRGSFALDPTDADLGDGLLMDQGLTVIWVGWQWDVPKREHALVLDVPVARAPGGETIEGLVRADWVAEEPTRTLPLAHRDHVAYEAADPDDERNVLTVRDERLGERRTIPRDRWRFAREDEEGRIVEDRAHVYMEEGFEPGRIYEMVYVAKGPRVVGLGLAAVRDMASYAKWGEDCVFRVDHVVAFGVSQTGRFLRKYQSQRFNEDETRRRAIDAMLIHTAGAGLGSFNHRFAQPSRDAHRFSAFFYPTDVEPFLSRNFRQPEEHRPLVMYTNTGYEYWGRAASLIHTDRSGTRDVPPLPNERIYHLASGQHFVARGMNREEPVIDGLYDGNPLDFLVTLRALLVRLVEWVEEGREPPASRYPTIAAGTLLAPDVVRYPEVPAFRELRKRAVRVPPAPHEAHDVFYGDRWWTEGIVDVQPPRVSGPRPVLVPEVDRFGNEMGGVRGVEVRVPLATYLPWSLRLGMAGPEWEMRDFRGWLIPLAATEAERASTGDGRPSVQSLYREKGWYVKRMEEVLRELVEEGFLLERDVSHVAQRMWREWDWVVEGEWP